LKITNFTANIQYKYKPQMDQLLTTYIIIAVTVLVSMKGFNDREFTEKFLYKPYEVKHDKEWYRIFTHTLLHADWMHLLFNMFALYGFGLMVEQTYIVDYDSKLLGTLYFLALYILGALFATIIPYFRNQDNPGYRSLGASGAVSAVIFAGVLMFPQAKLYVYFIEMPAWLFGPLYLAYEFWADRNSKTGIAHDAHIGGAIFGILFVLITNIERVKESFNLLF